MKFSDLKLLFSYEKEKIKKQKLPQERYIIVAYNNVIKEIDNYSDTEKVTEKKINQLDITDHMKEKLIFLAKKTVPNFLKEKAASSKLRNDLAKLLGIGAKKIDELLDEGLTSINQLKSKKWFSKLHADTQLILKHNPTQQIPWKDIQKIENKLIGFRDNIEVVGSFRRHKPIVRDIDILFLHKTKDDIEQYLEYLKKEFANKIWIYAKGEMKISMIFQPGNNPDLKYKADIFITNRDNYYSMLLYATGSKEHNIKMRSIARRKSYLLNQDGIFHSKIKINNSKDDERALFKILDMEYVPPEKRF